MDEKTNHEQRHTSNTILPFASLPIDTSRNTNGFFFLAISSAQVPVISHTNELSENTEKPDSFQKTSMKWITFLNTEATIWSTLTVDEQSVQASFG